MLKHTAMSAVPSRTRCVAADGAATSSWKCVAGCVFRKRANTCGKKCGATPSNLATRNRRASPLVSREFLRSRVRRRGRLRCACSASKRPGIAQYCMPRGRRSKSAAPLSLPRASRSACSARDTATYSRVDAWPERTAASHLQKITQCGVVHIRSSCSPLPFRQRSVPNIVIIHKYRHARIADNASSTVSAAARHCAIGEPC